MDSTPSPLNYGVELNGPFPNHEVVHQLDSLLPANVTGVGIANLKHDFSEKKSPACSNWEMCKYGQSAWPEGDC